MIAYKCNICGLITTRIFKRCPSCGSENKMDKIEIEEVIKNIEFNNSNRQKINIKGKITSVKRSI